MKKLLFMLITFALSVIPKASFTQAPAMGTAADFVIFTSVGAITNSGIPFLTRLTGNVGSNSGSSTGFGNIDGDMADGTPASAQCAVDLLIAYNQLNIAVPTLFPASAMGSGQVLVPGVYLISSPATLDLDLTFDGLGDSTSVFIIQINGTFASSANSKVKLINGALACNIFWKVEGAVSLATGTTMRGTIIANNAAISMSVGDTLEGRLLSTNGGITLNNLFGYTPIGCSSVALTGPLEPDLASTACYAIFTSIGPVNNSGITTVVGDIGTNSALTLGYNPLFVTGMIHPVPDASTAACATDLANVYSYLNALPADIILVYPALFGHNLELTPHTYLMNGAVTFTDTLYLNAQGDPDAVFVIQANGAFGTTVNSRVVLTNGAQARNVYWKIDGATSINDFSIFNGTIVNAGAIDLTTGVQLNGRALTINGAVNTTAIDVIMPLGCSTVSEPIIILEPTNQIACVGDSVSFIVSATGTGLSYQWRKGSVNLVDGGNISGATNDTLTINPVGLADAGTDYNVIVSGVYLPNDTSNSVSLTVGSAFVLMTEPTNEVVCEGDSVSFIVSTTGLGLSYQWYNGMVNLIDGATISGATSDTLTINPVNISDASPDYYVIISSPCSPNDTSINVFLQVDSAPVIVIEPINQTACAGDSISFIVSATGNGLSYQWRRGITPLVDGGNIAGSTNDTLTINPTGISDAATDYNVIVSGTCLPADTSLNVSLIITTAAVITSEPVDQIICSGNSVSFSVISTGLFYQWRKGSANLIDGGNISGATTAILTINPAGVSDSSTDYNVIVSGACALNDTSVNASLVVNETPVALASSNSPVCTNSSIFLYAANVAGGTYLWTNASGYSSTDQNSEIILATVTDAGIYSLTVTANGCTSAIATTNVIVTDCISDLSVVKTVDNVNVIYGNNVVFTIVVTNNGPGDATGVEVSDVLQNGYTFVSYVATIGSYNAITGIWAIGNLANGATATLTVTATVNESGNHVNTAVVYSNSSDANMVDNVSFVETFPTDFFIPEGFSPSGDLVNDLFVIRGILNYPENELIVFNRWGNEVYSAKPYESTWNGTCTMGISMGGDELPAGTYFYVLDLGNGSPVYKGTIYLNR